jgi:hypothetical protein
MIRVTRERHDAIVRALNATAADLALGWPGLAAQSSKIQRGS